MRELGRNQPYVIAAARGTAHGVSLEHLFHSRAIAARDSYARPNARVLLRTFTVELAARLLHEEEAQATDVRRRTSLRSDVTQRSRRYLTNGYPAASTPHAPGYLATGRDESNPV